jgi:NDP-sugar pyrophosphorylase family protein
MKVVVPMAGRGYRFAEAGFETPKPLIDVLDRPMVAWALESLRGIAYSDIYFVCLREHERAYGMSSILKELAGPDAHVIFIDNVTEGQLCTVLAAREAINCDEDLLVMSCDTLVVSSLGQDIAQRPDNCRGIISVAKLPGDRWSFARTNATGRVVEVAEKRRISDLASTGMYYFSNGTEFLSATQQLIAGSERTHGEYYVIPVYDKYITRGLDVHVSEASEVWDLGTPEAVGLFEKKYETLLEMS